MTEKTQPPAGDKPLVRGGCSEPGCRVPRQMANFKDEQGHRWCISHAPDRGAKMVAVRRGAALSHAFGKVLEPGAPDPVFRSKEEVVEWCEQTAGQVLRGEVDERKADSANKLAVTALQAQGMAAQDLLERLSKVVNVRGRRA